MKTLTGNKALEKLIQMAFRNSNYACDTCNGTEFTLIQHYRSTNEGQKLTDFTAKCDSCGNQLKYEFEKKNYKAN